ncbi:hypothetical protein ABE10_10645, partial [Bacillus toyonensis]|nr:hypothetical protein [Bacillus toyonensis]
CGDAPARRIQGIAASTRKSSALRLPERAELTGRLGHSGGHRRLGDLAPGARVVDLLVADLAVHLQDAVVVREHVACDRPGEGVLGVGVDVHLHDAVRDRERDLLVRRPGAAVEDEVERLRAGAVLRRDLLLDLAEQLGAELDVARLIHAVHIAEGEGGDVSALVAEAEGLDGLVHVGEGGVERIVRALVADAVFLAADHPDLDLENGVDVLHSREEILGDLDVLPEGDRRAVPHMRLEDRVAAGPHLFLRCGDQRLDEAGEGVLRAVVGVEGHGDGVGLGDLGGVLGEGEGTGRARLDRVTREVVGTAGGDLDDAVRAGLGQALQHGMDRLRARDVERGVGEAARLRAVEHLCVLIRGGNGHGISCAERRFALPLYPRAIRGSDA